MSHLGSHFRGQRVARGLRRAELARAVGYRNITKGCRRIGMLEQSGRGDRWLVQRVSRILGVAEGTVKELGELDYQEYLQDWNVWVNRPIRPYLMVWVMPAVYQRKELPEGVNTFDEATLYAARIAAQENQKCCLVWSRLCCCWFDERGQEYDQTVSVPGKPNQPFSTMSLISESEFKRREDIR